jgi:hypothetical protein
MLMIGLTNLSWENGNLARIVAVRVSTSNAALFSARSATLLLTKSVVCPITTQADLLWPNHTWRLWLIRQHLTRRSMITVKALLPLLLLTLSMSRPCWRLPLAKSAQSSSPILQKRSRLQKKVGRRSEKRKENSQCLSIHIERSHQGVSKTRTGVESDGRL